MKCVRTELSVYLIEFDVPMFVGGKRGGQEEQRARQKSETHGKLKTFWRFVYG